MTWNFFIINNKTIGWLYLAGLEIVYALDCYEACSLWHPDTKHLHIFWRPIRNTCASSGAPLQLQVGSGDRRLMCFVNYWALGWSHYM